ncbi:ABC transporter ATP-binding protein [Galbitalea soli]|uniref:ABC transporter ATP-binding protein n=1 Tax=Galbitalea soli TaxID=1268042 RepID=A0A7C9PMD7_9MICO|nr:ABC transporter ATP-binding protein [Galbitalea soli]NEM90766.1 ABC transporter ATP-binding protein [Galbitalea soli]NYJ31484.1 ABC-type sulfate/molybdate transport systems ATPase subunit [Galbitalea soli]
MTTPALDAHLVARRGDFRLDLRLRVPRHTITAIVGPNGSGKTTALRTLAGLIRPDAGHIRVGDRVLDDVEAGIHVPPARRGTGVVFQDYLLFPHLSAAENVAFGLAAQGLPHREALERARAWLDRIDLGALAGVRPGLLSGGQAQRVALARALILDPAVLLLDEPMAALDVTTRQEVRAELGSRLRAFGGTTVIVTHDPADALALADEIVVLAEGGVVQRGVPAELVASPVNAYVESLFAASRGGIA